jgi:peptidoglycan/xylan/chitin deacetylase (PgdA/CDA1 family)
LVAVSALMPAAVIADPATAAAPGVTALVDTIIGNYRKIILLHESGTGKLSRDRATAGHYLFFQNRQSASQLVDVAARDVDDCQALVDYWTAGAGWMEVDRLALGGVFTELELRLAAANPCLPKLKAARAQLQAVRAAYNREVTAVLDDRADTVPGSRPKWKAYVNFLEAHDSVAHILSTLDLAPAVRPGSARPAPTAAALAKRALQDEWTDGELPDKTVLLTFDDGPHAIYTPRILDLLAKHHVHAVFFMIGQNLGAIDADGNVKLHEPALVARLLKEGHAVANHTHTHPLLPRLDEIRLTDEIDLTEVLLTGATPGGAGRAKLFRSPYGARNDLVLAEIAARGLRSVLWNIDSRDWADPIPQSVAKRVLDEIAHEGRGIVLFHDIHPRTVDAVALVIESLRRQGYRFARFEDGKLVVDDGGAPPGPNAAPRVTVPDPAPDATPR